MSDIFISYNNKDKAKAELFARAFERESWSVFWDKAIPPGKTFDQYINEQLEAAKCVVVLWSEGSINSDWVKEEGQRGVHRKILVPVFIQKVTPPLGFGRIEAAELFGWEGDTSDVEFQNLLKAIEALIPRHPGEGTLAEQTPPASVGAPQSRAAVTDKHLSVAREPRSPSAASQKNKKYVFSGVAALAVLVILFIVWQRGRDISMWVFGPPGIGQKDPAPGITGGWGVVFGSDISVKAAQDEITRASTKGIPMAKLYLRNGYYASIAVVDNRSTAQEFLAIAKTFRPDAYIASMATWCRNPQPRDGFVECQSGQ
jgi:hypothetical protein